jgi:hypothetical protein
MTLVTIKTSRPKNIHLDPSFIKRYIIQPNTIISDCGLSGDEVFITYSNEGFTFRYHLSDFISLQQWRLSKIDSILC